MEFAAVEIAVLIAVALIAGAINTVAGGGSNLVLPTLMIMGMPPEIANATNRVGIFVESVVAVSEFKRHDRLETFDLRAILIPMAIGGLFGSLAAAFAPPDVLKPLLIGTMIFMSLLVLLRPAVVSPPSGTAVRRVKDTRPPGLACWLLGFMAGFCTSGGRIFVACIDQAHCAATLCGRSAIKLIYLTVFTTVSLVIFVGRIRWHGLPVAFVDRIRDQRISWGVKLAVYTDPKILRWFCLYRDGRWRGATLLVREAPTICQSDQNDDYQWLRRYESFLRCLWARHLLALRRSVLPSVRQAPVSVRRERPEALQ